VTASLLEQLADLPKAEVDALIRAMAPGEANAFEYHWRYRARPEQLAPVGSWRVWLLMAGRGFGKRLRVDSSQRPVRGTELGRMAPQAINSGPPRHRQLRIRRGGTGIDRSRIEAPCDRS
jgi:phage terminase large subunit-like protein